MTDNLNKQRFEAHYAGQAPWDIGKPQKPFIDVADQITGSILDAGCGSGEAALFLASRGNKVTGFDFIEEPFRRAELHDTFGNGWDIESVQAVRVESQPDLKSFFSEGGAKAWFAVIRHA